MGLFSLEGEQKDQSRHLIHVYQYLLQRTEEMEPGSSQWLFGVRARDNDPKLKYKKFHVNLPYYFFSIIILNFYFLVRISQKGYEVSSL